MAYKQKHIYSPENTVVTIWEDPYSQKTPPTDPRVRRYYCPIPKGAEFGMGSLCIMTNPEDMTAEVEDFEIWNDSHGGFRGKGIGKHLMKACVADLKKLGFATLVSEDVSSDALYVRRSILPENSMQFYDHDNLKAGALPLSIGQVIQSTERISEANQNSISYGSGAIISHFEVRLDLGSVDTEGWPEVVDQEMYLSNVRAAS